MSNTLLKLQKLFFVLFVFFLPTQLSFHFWFPWSFVWGRRIDYWAPTIFFTDIIIWILILIAFFLNFRIKIKKIYFLYIGLILANIIFSINREVSIYKWLKVIEFLFFTLSLIKYKSNLKNLFFYPALVSLLTTCLLSILQVVNEGSLGGIWYWLGERFMTINTNGVSLSNFFGKEIIRPYAFFPHPNVLASFLVLYAFLAFYTIPSKFKKFYPLFLIPVSLVFVLSNSQASCIALILAVLFSFKKFLFNKLYFYGAIFLSLLSPVISSLLLVYGKLPLSTEIKTRMITLVFGGMLFSKNPIFGSGLGTALFDNRDYSVSLITNHFQFPFIWFQPIHNIFVLLLTELGIFGFILIFYFSFIKIINSTVNQISIFTLTYILGTSLFDHYWATLQQGSLLIVLVLVMVHYFDFDKIRS